MQSLASSGSALLSAFKIMLFALPAELSLTTITQGDLDKACMFGLYDFVAAGRPAQPVAALVLGQSFATYHFVHRNHRFADRSTSLPTFKFIALVAHGLGVRLDGLPFLDACLAETAMAVKKRRRAPAPHPV